MTYRNISIYILFTTFSTLSKFHISQLLTTINYYRLKPLAIDFWTHLQDAFYYYYYYCAIFVYA